MYMKLYKTRDLQKNTKEVLDAADKDTVIIQRGTGFYRLVGVNLFDQMQESQEKTPPAEKSEPKIISGLPPNVDDLIKQAPEYDPEVAKRQQSGEQSCCLNENRPCKHWVWDTSTGDGYRNTLSGRFLEVE